MTIVGIPFIQNTGVHWTLTILGRISVLLVPVAYVFTYMVLLFGGGVVML